jgi:hypothetical protein
MPMPPKMPAGTRSDSQPESGATIMLVSGQGAIAAPISAGEKPACARRNGVDSSNVIEAMNAV